MTDAEWALLAPVLPPPSGRGRPWAHPRREVVNALWYVLRTGCQWRLLPREFPPWQTVYHHFQQWRRDGTWVRVHATLRTQVRARAGRGAQPSAGIVDSQSVKTTGVGGVRGYDGGKKVVGRKRHILVDGQGLLLRVAVHSAAIQDRAGIPLLLAGADREFPRLRHVWVDRGYTGTNPAGGAAWITQQLGWHVDISQPAGPPQGARGGWIRAPIDLRWPGAPADRGPRRWVWLPPVHLTAADKADGVRTLRPRRWVVERTFSWFGQSRRLSKDYERLPHVSESLIYATMTRLLLRRLVRPTAP